MKADSISSFEATGIHLVVGDRFLLVLRPPHKRHPLTWSAVGGKLESGETALDAIRREVHEETGIDLTDPEQVSCERYEHDGVGFEYHQFIETRDAFPEVTLNDEHIGYGWFTIEEARGLRLMEDELELLEETVRLLGSRI